MVDLFVPTRYKRVVPYIIIMTVSVTAEAIVKIHNLVNFVEIIIFGRGSCLAMNYDRPLIMMMI